MVPHVLAQPLHTDVYRFSPSSHKITGFVHFILSFKMVEPHGSSKFALEKGINCVQMAAGSIFFVRFSEVFLAFILFNSPW